MCLVASADRTIIALGEESPRIEEGAAGIEVRDCYQFSTWCHALHIAIVDHRLSGYGRGTQSAVVTTGVIPVINHEKSQIARTCNPVLESGAGAVCRPVWNPIDTITDPVEKTSRLVPQSVTIGIESSRFIALSHRLLLGEVAISVKVDVDSFVDAGSQVIDHQHGDFTPCPVLELRVGMEPMVIIPGERGWQA